MTETGNIVRADGKTFAYTIELLAPRHFDIVSELQQQIVREIGDPIFYDPVAEESILKRFESEGRIIGTFVGQRLVGARIIHFPRVEGDNFGKDIDFSPVELPKVAHLAAIMVQKDFRENQLALKMNRHAVDLIEKLGFAHIFATVFPANHANVTTLFNTGLVIVGLKYKYGGKLRYIFYRPPTGLPIFSKSEITVPETHHEVQTELLEKGFVGIATDERDGKFHISYRKPSVRFP